MRSTTSAKEMPVKEPQQGILSKVGAYILFWGFLAVLNLPNFFWLSPHGAALLDGADFVESLLPCLLLGACFLALFSRPWLAWLLLWWLFLWWQPLALGVRATNGTVINATLVGMAFATSPAELRELALAIPSGWGIFFVAWNVICAGGLYGLIQHNYWYWGRSFRGKVIFFCVCMLALPYIVLPRMHEPDMGWMAVVAKDSEPLQAFADADQSGGIMAHLPEAFPYELPKAVVHYLQARRVVEAMHAQLQSPDPNYTLAEVSPQADVIVLVVGESSTRNAWHLFNPKAPPTTPNLEARAQKGEYIWGYAKTLAQTTSTRQAVPSMLTAQPLVWPSGKANSRATRSIISVAAQAGYATAWFSNQTAIGKHDGIIASYAREAASVAFLNPSGFTEQGSFDAVLLPALRRYLAENTRAFVVLHTLGSHFNYSHRVPTGFGLYPQASNEREAYFNSVAYTDWLLDQAIETLTRDGRRAVLVYISDHGETVPSGVCNTGSANRTTRDAYEVPALVWLSNAYAQAHPTIVEKLSANRSEPYTVAAVHQTLLDLMRADTAMPLPDPHVQSFVRPAFQSNINKQKDIPVWTKKLEEAFARNPCFVQIP